MTIEAAIIDLTTQTTNLLDVCSGIKDSTTSLIANAVIVSENAAISPLLIVAKNLIDTQTLLVSIISKGN